MECCSGCAKELNTTPSFDIEEFVKTVEVGKIVSCVCDACGLRAVSIDEVGKITVWYPPLGNKEIPFEVYKNRRRVQKSKI